MNVLITCSGRRTSLLRAFKKAVTKRDGKVIAADADPMAPTLYLADEGVQLPLVSSPSYLDQLVKVVKSYRIGLLVPTIDTELPLLASSREAFLKIGCVPLISKPPLVHVAGDKWEMVQAFVERGIKTPRSWLPNGFSLRELPEEVFVKPREGSASRHTYRVPRQDLERILPLVPNPIIQEYIPCPEITVDALLDLEGRVIHYVPRRRIKTIGGESIQGVTLPDDDIKAWLLRVLSIVAELGGRGPITVQAFVSSEGPILSEINPRFGGGFPLTLAAGGDYPEWIMQILEGRYVEPRIGQYRKHLYMTRYYVEMILDHLLWDDLS